MKMLVSPCSSQRVNNLQRTNEGTKNKLDMLNEANALGAIYIIASFKISYRIHFISFRWFRTAEVSEIDIKRDFHYFRKSISSGDFYIFSRKLAFFTDFIAIKFKLFELRSRT